jgi:PAS domain S-box-containing protein
MVQSINKNNVIVVGIGASAGGLEALQEFIKNLPHNNDKLAYIIAQHLSPTYKSMMVELLRKNSPLDVVEAADGLKIEARKIYIAPPNNNIFIADDTIILKTPLENFVGPKPSIDMFFASIAQSKKHEAVGIILSGTGTDGSRGCAQIKAEGGITIAQDPKDAKYDGMPASAIHAGQIDIVLPADQIGSELEEIEKYISGEITLHGVANRSKDGLGKIFSRIKETQGVDFSEYKTTTINRRIKRRMAALKIAHIDEYIDYLYTDKQEPCNLFKDFLIGVTSFFRDGEAFEELQTNLAQVLSAKDSVEPIRIWDVGCYTGEEAYSVAITIAEIFESQGIRKDVQIFATDIDESATQLARHGVYSAAAVADIPQELLRKYFIAKNESYQVSKTIRDMIIFSRHDLVRDPPFTRLDLIVCRNLLIYFNASLQERIMPMFHYTLQNGGLLFLGKSESIGNFANLFTPLTKNTKIYRREFSIGKETLKNFNSYTPAKGARHKQEIILPVQKKSLQDSLLASLGEYFLPLSVIVNEGMDIVFVKERNPYLVYAPGATTTNVFKSVHESLSLELRTLIHRCTKSDKPQVGTFHGVELFEGITRFVRIVALPLKHHHEAGKLYVISFQEESAEAFGGGVVKLGETDGQESEKLEAQLAQTKMHLQTVIEELETSNEELQSLNEELQSANEELQSTNEELETTNEELQSTNEELQTAYAELRAIADEKEVQRKRVEDLNEELSFQRSLLEGIVNSSLDAIMALSPRYHEELGLVDFEWTMANSRCVEILSLVPEVLIQKRLFEQKPAWCTEEFADACKYAMEENKSSELEIEFVENNDTRYFKTAIVPFGNGIVVSFDDISLIKTAMKEITLSEGRMIKEKIFEDQLMDTSNAMVVVLDENANILRFNKSAQTLTGYDKYEVLGKNWFSVFIPIEKHKDMKKVFKQLVRNNIESGKQYENQITLKDGSERMVSWRNSVTVDQDGKPIVLSFGIDSTERYLADQHLKLQDEYLHAIVDSQDAIIIVTDGASMMDANQAFFEFFSEFDSFEAFKTKHKCVCEFFEKVDKPNFVYEGMGGANWIDLIAKEGIHQALIKRGGIDHYFVLRQSKLNSGHDLRRVVSMVDVTELENFKQLLELKITHEIIKAKEQEQIMIQQGKMAAMGEMLGAIAHQWRQPLNALGITIQDVEQAWVFKEIDDKYIAEFKSSSMRLIQHMSKTIDDFRNFFKPTTVKEQFLAHESLNEAMEIFSAQFKINSIEVENIFAKNGCDAISCNKNQLKQVVLNIISNAKDATIESIESKHIENGKLVMMTACKDKVVCISIWNNGKAISSDVLDRVFEPYFTTKEQGKGTGIGLYMSKIIVEQNLNGKIAINNKDNGVEVMIEIPAISLSA